MNIVALAIVWIVSSPVEALPQSHASDVLTIGRQQLERARSENSDAAYRQAEDSFTKTLESEAGNIDALTGRGEARTARGVLAFSNGAVGSGMALFTDGAADLDKAATLAPARLDVRLIRGWTYGVWPAYAGKAGVAREDLELTVKQSEFGSLPADQRARAFQVLGIVYTNFGETDKARDSFQSAIDAAPNSSFGKDAGQRLGALRTGFADRYLNLNLSILGWPHTAACLVAIAAFFPVMFTRKGGRTHRRWGRVYSVAYAAACLTSLGIYRSGQFIFAHWLALAGLVVLAAGYFAVRFKPPAWRYVHLLAMLLSAYNLFGGAVNEAFLRIKPLGTWAGGFASPLFGMTHALIMLLFVVLIVVYLVVTALRPAPRAKSAAGA
jgi:tetratricopeptide (TPR) repeat protein